MTTPRWPDIRTAEFTAWRVGERNGAGVYRWRHMNGAEGHAWLAASDQRWHGITGPVTFSGTHSVTIEHSPAHGGLDKREALVGEAFDTLRQCVVFCATEVV